MATRARAQLQAQVANFKVTTAWPENSNTFHARSATSSTQAVLVLALSIAIGGPDTVWTPAVLVLVLALSIAIGGPDTVWARSLVATS